MKKLFIIDHKGRGNYAYVTDGENIASIEHERFGGYNVSTVHIPNVKTGTGFRVFEQITIDKIESSLLSAMSTFVPYWASSTDRKHTKKWPNAEAFLVEQRKFWKDAHLIPFNIHNLFKNCKHDGHYMGGFPCTICGREK